MALPIPTDNLPGFESADPAGYVAFGPPKPVAALITPDPFAKRHGKVAEFIPDFYHPVATSGPVEQLDEDALALRQMTRVSRPVNGFQPKPNTFATVQVIDAKGKRIKLFNRLGAEYDDTDMSRAKRREGAGADPASLVWTDWLLTQVQEQRGEKTQIVETFGETYLYAFGERPRMLSFSGILFNTADLQWRAIFWENWDKFFRATQLVERNARMYIYYDDILVEGYPLDASANQSSTDPAALHFQFSFLVTNYTNLVAARNFDIPRHSTVSTIKAGYAESASEFTIKDDRISLLEFLGTSGASKASLLVSKEYGNLAGGAAYDILSGAAASMPASLFGALASSGIEGFETQFNLKPGEVNRWFGHIEDILLGRVSVAGKLNSFVPMANSLSGTAVGKLVSGVSSDMIAGKQAGALVVSG